MAVSEVWSSGRIVQRFDTETGYTRFDAAGNIVEQRSLTAAELAAIDVPPDPRDDLRAQIAAAESPAELQALLLQAIDLGVL